MISHTSPISGIDSFAGKYVATAGYDNRVIIWDAPSRKALSMGAHDHLANYCRFSSCGNFLVTASSDYTARIWSVPSMRLVAVLTGHCDDVDMAVPCPNSEHIATASQDDTIGIYSFKGKNIQRLEGHVNDVNAVEWISNSEIISSGDDGTIRQWNALDGSFVQKVEVGGSQADTIAFADKNLIFAGNDDGEIAIIRGSAKSCVKAHDAGIKKLSFDKNRQVLVSSSYDRAIKGWSISADRSDVSLIWETKAPPQVWVRSFAFGQGSSLIFGTFGTKYATYNWQNEKWDLSGVEATNGLNAVLISDDVTYSIGDSGVAKKNGVTWKNAGSLCNFLIKWGERILAGGQLGELYDLESGTVVDSNKSPLTCGTTFIRGTETYLVVGTYTGQGLIFALDQSGQLYLSNEIQLHDNSVKSVACSDKFIFSLCASGAAAFHSIENLRSIKEIPSAHTMIANSAQAMPNGSFASTGRDRRLLIWEGPAAAPREIMTPHSHSVKCLAVSPCGQFIATGAYNGLICIYDVYQDAWVKSERPTTSGISALAAANDHFAAASYDGQVYLIER